MEAAKVHGCFKVAKRKTASRVNGPDEIQVRLTPTGPARQLQSIAVGGFIPFIP